MSDSTATGISLGSAVAAAKSYALYHHVGWAILQGFFGWGTLLYWWITGESAK